MGDTDDQHRDMSARMSRRLAAEFLGTLFIVFVGAGSFVAALTATHGRLTYAPIGFIAVAFAIAVAGAVYAFGSLSGGHFNPAITIALIVVRRFSVAAGLPYIIAQLLGGAVGALLVIATFGHGAASIHVTGGTTLGTGVNDVQGMAAEAVGTAFLMFTVMALAIDRRAPTGWAGLVIGLAVAGDILVIGPLTSGSVNPARTTGPYLMSAIFGHGAPWHEYFIYWVGPCVGATVAALGYELVMRPERPRSPADS